MKQKKTSLSTQSDTFNAVKKHFFDPPLRDNAFDLDDNTKIIQIEKHFKEIMITLGLDLTNDSLKDTPKRVAKMFINESFFGLNPKNKPNITLFENDFNYNQMLIEKNINFFSFCEHHFLPFYGYIQIGYFPKKKVIGLSKINRLVKYYSKRPQVQERLTQQIIESFKEVLQTNDVAVYIEAKHMCVTSRGTNDINSNTITFQYSGKFLDQDIKNEFLNNFSRNTNNL